MRAYRCLYPLFPFHGIILGPQQDIHLNAALNIWALLRLQALI